MFTGRTSRFCGEMSAIDNTLPAMGNDLWELEGQRDQALENNNGPLVDRCSQRILEIAKQAYTIAQKHGPDEEMAAHVAALALRMMGRWEESEGGYQRVLKLNPVNAEAWLELTWVRAELGKTKAALEAAHTAAQLMPEHAEAWLNLAACLVEADEFDTALEALEEAERLEPDNPRVSELRATLLNK